MFIKRPKRKTKSCILECHNLSCTLWVELMEVLCLLKCAVWLLKVHITQGDSEGKGVIISWTTADEPGSNTVLYWAENSKIVNRADGSVLTYKYYNYTSGFIHHCTIKDLEVCKCCNYWQRLFCFILAALAASYFHIFPEDKQYFLFVAVWYQILLWSRDWEHNTTILVCDTSQSWTWRSLYIWSHRYNFKIRNIDKSILIFADQ